MDEVPEAILERIKKLLNLADLTKNDSQAEAENAARKAQDLMLEYNISLQQLHKGQEIPIKEHFINPEALLVKNEGPWLKSLYFGMLKLNFCKSWTINKGKKGMQIIGEPQNIEMAQYMIDQLIPRIRSLAKQAWRDYDQGFEKKNTFIRGFLEGCVRGVISKLESNQRMRQHTNQNVAGLVLVKNAAVQKYFEGMGMRLRAAGGKQLSGKSGFQIGRETGSGMSIHKGVGTNKSSKYLN